MAAERTNAPRCDRVVGAEKQNSYIMPVPDGVHG